MCAKSFVSSVFPISLLRGAGEDLESYDVRDCQCPKCPMCAMCLMCPLSPVFPGCEKLKKIERHKMSRLNYLVSQMQASSIFSHNHPCATEGAFSFVKLLSAAVKVKSHDY